MRSRQLGGFQFAGPPGTIIKGAILTMNPIVLSSISQAVPHGFASAPDFYKVELECLVSEGGYIVGGILNLSSSMVGDANGAINDSYQLVSFQDYYQINISANVRILNTSQSSISITAANWKLTVTPYKIN